MTEDQQRLKDFLDDLKAKGWDGRWAVHEPVEKLWIGTTEGVTLHESFNVALLAAEVLNRAGTPKSPARYLPVPYMGEAVRIRDSITLIKPVEEVIADIEAGR